MKRSSVRQAIARRHKQLRVEPLEHRLLLATDVHTELGELRLTDEEAYYLQTVHHLDSPEVRISSTGRPYYVDPAAPETARQGEDATGTSGGSSVKIALDQLPQLNSNPDAPNTFYIDFTGQVVRNTDWNVSENGGRPIHAAPYDTDGDRTTFSEEEVAAIREIWQRVSEDFLPFNINITTVEPPASAFTSGRGATRAIVTTNVDDLEMGGTGKTWFDGAGGVAYIASWLTPGDLPVWVFHNKLPQTVKAVAEGVAHEFGHAVGLSHDGSSDSAYYNGHGEGETSWAPIMGAGYTANVTQWSKGDYLGANNTEKDITIITSRFNEITFREDDHGNWEPDATPLQRDGGQLYGAGIITERNDLDFFSFEHSGGPVNILVAPAELGPNLDVSAEIFDDQENQLEVFAPLETLYANISMELDPGTYYLLVEGGGYIPPGGEEGYNDYASLGQYTITGFLGEPMLTANAGGSGDGCGECGACAACSAGSYIINEGDALKLDGSRSYGPVDEIWFDWDVDGDGEFDDAQGEFATLTWAQLEQLDRPINDDGSYRVALQVRDARGNVDEDTANLTVQNRPPQASITSPAGTLYAGAEISFHVDASDIAQDSLTYSWNFGDGSEEVVAREPTIHHTFEVGSYEVSVTIRDDDGGSTTEELSLQIHADLPRVIASSVDAVSVLGRPESLEVRFSHDVSASLNPSDIYLFDVVKNVIVNPPNPSVQWLSESNTAVFSLNDTPVGSYTIVLLGGGVTNGLGTKLDGDGDGDEGGNWSSNVNITHPGDANLDLKVDFNDFLVLANHFGSMDANWETGDFNGDGTVSFADFLVMSKNFGAHEQVFQPL